MLILNWPHVPARAGAAERGSQLEGGLVWGRPETPRFCAVGPGTQAGSLNASAGLSFEGRASSVSFFLRPSHIPSKLSSRERRWGVFTLCPRPWAGMCPGRLVPHLPLWLCLWGPTQLQDILQASHSRRSCPLNSRCFDKYHSQKQSSQNKTAFRCVIGLEGGIGSDRVCRGNHGRFTDTLEVLAGPLKSD